jgi:hypothetical protein
MQKNPSATITLVGSSNNSNSDGLTMAESVKTYLKIHLQINASRITTKVKTNIPSEQPEEHKIKLLREGDRRVSIESNSPDLLMEFQSGPNAPLKPVQINCCKKHQLKVMLLLIIKELEKPYRHGLYS